MYPYSFKKYNNSTHIMQNVCYTSKYKFYLTQTYICAMNSFSQKNFVRGNSF